MPKTFDVVALGEAMIEFNQTSPGQPQCPAGLRRRHQQCGDRRCARGSAHRPPPRAWATTASAVQLLELWRREEVDTRAIEVDPAQPTGIYFVTHGPHGHEFSYRRAGSAASKMTPGWLNAGAADAIRNAKILHVSGISMAISPGACETVLAAMRIGAPMPAPWSRSIPTSRPEAVAAAAGA